MTESQELDYFSVKYLDGETEENQASGSTGDESLAGSSPSGVTEKISDGSVVPPPNISTGIK